MVQLTRVKYHELKAKQKEIYNFQKVAGLLADYGFNCIKLSDDWHGADFLAYHKDHEQTLKVQLKSRLYILRHLIGKDLYMAFPNKDRRLWYLIAHDELVELARLHTPWLDSGSWAAGSYSTDSPSATMVAALRPHAIGLDDDLSVRLPHEPVS